MKNGHFRHRGFAHSDHDLHFFNRKFLFRTKMDITSTFFEPQGGFSYQGIAFFKLLLTSYRS